MATTRAKTGTIYIATESGACEINGETQIFVKQRTRVREGHPLLKAVPDYFRPIDEMVDYDVETATAAPGERKGA